VEGNNNNKHAYAGTTDSFTHLTVLLVLTDCGIQVEGVTTLSHLPRIWIYLHLLSWYMTMYKPSKPCKQEHVYARTKYIINNA
jgi:hypothetical protein